MKVSLFLLSVSIFAVCVAHANSELSISETQHDTSTVSHNNAPNHFGRCGENATLISTIQGSGEASEEVGKRHIVEAIITGKRSNGFFIQEETADYDDNDATSEGLFVEGTTDIEVGHVVRVYGEVIENYGLTTLKLNSNSHPIDCAKNTDISITHLRLPYDVSLEPFEGMLVEVTNATVTSTNKLLRYGEIVVSSAMKRQPSDLAPPLTSAYNEALKAQDASLLVIEDNTDASYPEYLSYFPTFSYNNAIRIGDMVSATGPLNYSYGAYRINPTNTIRITSTREPHPVVAQGDLSIATFNVLNYFNGKKDNEGRIHFNYKGNRGAQSKTEFELQQARIVAAIVNLNADVIGVMEIENDGFENNSAIQSLTNAINQALDDDKQYAFIRTEDGKRIGTDAITVGLFYRPSVVSPRGNAKVVLMPIQQLSNGKVAQMRPSLIQSFVHNKSKKTFAVAVNHFKSKGSKCAEDLVEPLSEIDAIQGSCNALRVSAAITLGNALSDIGERVILLGDFNSYSHEDPIAVLSQYSPQKRGYTIKTAKNTSLNGGASVAIKHSYGYHNLAERFDPDGFSYWYYGSEKIGSLDHVLVSDAMLADAIDGTHWNINSPEVYQLQYNQALRNYSNRDTYSFTDVGPFRSSDHDPFIATFKLTSDELPTKK